MGQSHKPPGGQTFGERELQGYAPRLVCHQLGIEERGLVQVLTHLHLIALCFLLCICFFNDLLGLEHLTISHVIAHHLKGVFRHPGGRLRQHPRLSHHGSRFL